MPNDPNGLPFLSEDSSQPPGGVQRTKFTRNSMGRFICNTWDEVTKALLQFWHRHQRCKYPITSDAFYIPQVCSTAFIS